MQMIRNQPQHMVKGLPLGTVKALSRLLHGPLGRPVHGAGSGLSLDHVAEDLADLKAWMGLNLFK